MATPTPAPAQGAPLAAPDIVEAVRLYLAERGIVFKPSPYASGALCRGNQYLRETLFFYEGYLSLYLEEDYLPPPGLVGNSTPFFFHEPDCLERLCRQLKPPGHFHPPTPGEPTSV